METGRDVFISYSSKDSDKVNTIKHILETNQITCWMAPESIPIGSSYAKEIPLAIMNCKVFLLMLTFKSQESQWVPKELSLAITDRKCVLPFILEECTLTDVFNFFLTDVQRFYAFYKNADSLKKLIDRIKDECGKTKDKGILIGSSEISDVQKWIVNTDKNLLNRDLSKLLVTLRKRYKENPNAENIQQWLQCYKLKNFSLENILNAIYTLMIPLPSAAENYIQIAVIYIHSGARMYIQIAREFLNRAVQIYLNQPVYDEMAFKRIVYARWLISVTYKQERNFGYANELCEDLINYIKDENQIFDLPYSESLLLPQRELAVINKEEVMSDYLLLHIDDIKINPKELFFTQRRLLELYILNNDFEKAKDILPDLLNSYEKCKNHIDEIYHVGLFQNLFEYYSYTGDRELADKYYKMAMAEAKKNFWKGKEKKLSNLKQLFE